MTLRITSSSNPRIKRLVELRRRGAAVDGQGGIFLEGPRLVDQALGVGCKLLELYVTPRSMERLSSWIAELSCEPVVVDERLLGRLADADSPRDSVAVVSRPPLWRADRAVPTAASRSSDTPGIWLYLDGLQDPGNLGAVARSALAFGCAGLAASSNSCRWDHPRALRASAGALFRLAVRTLDTPVQLDGLLASAQASRVEWLALSPHDGSAATELLSARGDRAHEPGVVVVLAVGSEGRGLSTSVTNHCSEVVTIPVHGIESLNVAVAVGIALYELTRSSASSQEQGSDHS